MVLEEFAFNEPEFVSFEDAEKVLIDEYFDENINETVYVYCFNDIAWYNITNNDLNSNIVVYFNLLHSSEHCDNYTRGLAFRCVRENLTGENKTEKDYGISVEAIKDD